MKEEKKRTRKGRRYREKEIKKREENWFGMIVVRGLREKESGRRRKKELC